MYMPAYETGTNLVIRTQGEPTAVAGAVRQAVQGIDPDQPVATIRTMDQWLENSVATPRYRTALLALFALVALVLASTGIYG
jgi:putative ABC transport system permease protein